MRSAARRLLRRRRRFAQLAMFVLAGLVVACGGDGGGTTPGPAGAGGAVDERIVLVRDQSLLLRSVRGAERALYKADAPNKFPAFPSWSPDGARVAYSEALFAAGATADWGDDLWVLTPATGAKQLVRKHQQTGQQIQGLTWTRDGNALLVGYRQTLIANGKLQGVTWEIHRVDLAAGQTTLLIKDALEPSLSRDGARIAYAKQDEAGLPTLWIANADGGDAKPVTLPPEVSPVFAPRISPDGGAVAFAAPSVASFSEHRGGRLLQRALALVPFLPRRALAHGVPMEVWRVDIGDSHLLRLTNFAEDDPRAAWEPDGRALKVLATGGLYDLAADGATMKKLGAGAFSGQLDVR